MYSSYSDAVPCVQNLVPVFLLPSPRPFINGKVEEKTAGDGPSLATMFEDDRHLQGIIQSIKVGSLWLDMAMLYKLLYVMLGAKGV